MTPSDLTFYCAKYSTRMSDDGCAKYQAARPIACRGCDHSTLPAVSNRSTFIRSTQDKPKRVKIHKPKPPKPKCIKCGREMHIRSNASSDRLDLCLCWKCFQSPRDKIRMLKEKKPKVLCAICGRPIKYQGPRAEDRIKRGTHDQCEQGKLARLKRRGCIIVDLDGKPVVMMPRLKRR